MLRHLAAFDIRTSRQHGGVLRSLQIAYLCNQATDAQSFTVRQALQMRKASSPSLSSIVRGISGLSGRRLLRCDRGSIATAVALSSLASPPSLLVWEPRPSEAPAPLGRRQPHGLIALPHNVESLVSTSDEHASHRRQLLRLRREAETLSRADLVYTISNDDQWLLSLLGINASVLPYYPPPLRTQQLADIRNRRSVAKCDTVLVMGTYSNGPSIRGVETLLKVLPKDPRVRICVVGKGSEQIPAPQGVELHGFLPEEKLAAELIRARCAIVWQTPTTGWPTRLIELTIMGIPVILNQASVRAQTAPPYGATMAGLGDLLDVVASFRALPPFPERPKEEGQFVESLKRLTPVGDIAK